MYEEDNGKVVLADSMLFSAYQSSYGTVLSFLEDLELYRSINAVKADGRCFLV